MTRKPHWGSAVGGADASSTPHWRGASSPPSSLPRWTAGRERDVVLVLVLARSFALKQQVDARMRSSVWLEMPSRQNLPSYLKRPFYPPEPMFNCIFIKVQTCYTAIFNSMLRHSHVCLYSLNGPFISLCVFIFLFAINSLYDQI